MGANILNEELIFIYSILFESQQFEFFTFFRSEERSVGISSYVCGIMQAIVI